MHRKICYKIPNACSAIIEILLQGSTTFALISLSSQKLIKGSKLGLIGSRGENGDGSRTDRARAKAQNLRVYVLAVLLLYVIDYQVDLYQFDCLSLVARRHNQSYI